jgi:hypothetical protein
MQSSHGGTKGAHLPREQEIPLSGVQETSYAEAQIEEEEMSHPKIAEAWCCGIAADHELGETSVTVYASKEDCERARGCAIADPGNCAPRKLQIMFETSWVSAEELDEEVNAAVDETPNEPMIPEYLLTDLRDDYDSLTTAITALGWNPPGTSPTGQNVPVECVVNIHQKGVIAKTVKTTGRYEDEEDGPDFHPNLPGPDMWGGIDVVLWREAETT